MKTNRQPPTKLRHLICVLAFMLCLAVEAQVPPTIVWQTAANNSYGLSPLAVSPDGAIVATLGADNAVQIRRMSNGSPLLSLPGNTLWIGDLAFSPDGTYLASGGGDNIVRVWRTLDWSLAYSIPTIRQGPPVAFAPDSATLAIGNGSEIELRRASNGAAFQSWTATASGEVVALAFSPDGSKLASGAGIRGQDTSLKIWEVPAGALIRSLPTAQTYSVGRIVFSPDGTQVLTGSRYLHSSPMQSWRVSDGLLLRTFPLAAYAMAFSADGTVLAAAGDNIIFFRASDGAVIQEYVDGYAVFTPSPKGLALTASGLFVRSRGSGEVLAGRVPTLVSPPIIEGGHKIIRWVGGTGRYQLQHSPVPDGGWQDEGGILITNAVSVTSANSNAFYRVISLPQ